MADVKWIKITTDMFDNRKIKHLRRLPDGNSIVLIWVMLLTLAGRCNSGGMIFLTENIPYTPTMLADELDFEESTVHLALTVLEQLGMIQTNADGFLTVTGWSEHQNIEGMDKIRESKRLAQAKWRAKQKALPSTVDSTVDSTVGACSISVDDAEEDIEEEIELERDIREYKEKTGSDDPAPPSPADSQIRYQEIADLYNSICKSFPAVRSLSEARRKAIKARLKTYTVDDFRAVFENAEASSFLKGSNDRNWSANFDWLIKDSSMAKVLEGTYADRERRYGRKETVPSWMKNGQKRELDNEEQEAIRRMMAENEQDNPP